MKRFAILIVLAACGGRDKLSEAECREWAEFGIGRDLEAISGQDPDLQEFRDYATDELMSDCRKGKVDRQELQCLRSAEDDLARMACYSAGEKRHKRNVFLPR